MAAFTYLWTNQCRLNMLGEHEDEPLDCSAGSAFRQRGVRVGDLVYVIAHNAGLTYLIGRMKVSKVSTRHQWDAVNDNPHLWDGAEVIDGVEGTPMNFERVIPLVVLRSMVFIDPNGNRTSLSIDADGYFGPQALRSVRCITDLTASRLDMLL